MLGRDAILGIQTAAHRVHVTTESTSAIGVVNRALPIRFSKFAALCPRNLELDSPVHHPVHEVVRVPARQRRLRLVDLEPRPDQRALQSVAQTHIVATKMGHWLQRLAAAMHGQCNARPKQHASQQRFGEVRRRHVQTPVVSPSSTRKAIEPMLSSGNRFGQFAGEWFNQTGVWSDHRDVAPLRQPAPNSDMWSLHKHQASNITVCIAHVFSTFDERPPHATSCPAGCASIILAHEIDGRSPRNGRYIFI